MRKQLHGNLSLIGLHGVWGTKGKVEQLLSGQLKEGSGSQTVLRGFLLKESQKAGWQCPFLSPCSPLPNNTNILLQECIIFFDELPTLLLLYLSNNYIVHFSPVSQRCLCQSCKSRQQWNMWKMCCFNNILKVF